MNTFIKLQTLIITVWLLSACASADGPPFSLSPIIDGKTTIYAFRTASIVGGGNSDIVSVNDRFIGRLNSGTYAVYNTEPGELLVKRKTGSIFFGEGESGGWGLGGLVGLIDGFVEVVSFTGNSNQIYFIRFPHGELVPNDEALEMMDRLENVTPE
ncbi:MAG: DUF2846 domain-containing protein [Gammaproteobacteria bacterium]|nr:DUF2846 domain-containing protein [Gammaproteobacteria bacterium]